MWTVGLIVLVGCLIIVGIGIYDWVQLNKEAIKREAERQRIRAAVNQGWRERQAAALAPLDAAVRNANDVLARVQLTTKERLDSTYSIINKRKED